MNKLTIPRFKYLAQDKDGEVFAYCDRPVPKLHNISCDVWLDTGRHHFATNISRGIPNLAWKDSLIDLDEDNYEFVGGILKKL